MTDPSLSPALTPSIPELSVVAPMYNEEGNIEAFVVAVEKVVARDRRAVRNHPRR